MPIIYSLPHWNYFRTMERDLEECFRYVAPTEEHMPVHSDEFAKLILVACSEIENALCALVKAIDKSRRCRTLPEYAAVILERFPFLPLVKIGAPRYGVSVTPWENWKENSPDWWKNGYNKIKHDRAGNPNAATLGRAFGAIAALQVILLYLYRHKFRVSIFPHENAPHLMEPIPEPGGFESAVMGWGWELPDDKYAIQKRERA